MSAQIGAMALTARKRAHEAGAARDCRAVARDCQRRLGRDFMLARQLPPAERVESGRHHAEEQQQTA